MKKLSNEQVKEMRERYKNGEREDQLAQRFNVHRTTVDWHLGELRHRKEPEASFETPVTFKMILVYIYAWITKKKVIHTGISITINKHEQTN